MFTCFDMEKENQQMEIQLAQSWDASQRPDWMVLFLVASNDEQLPILPNSTPAELKSIVENLHESEDLPTGKGEVLKLYKQSAPLASRILIVCVGKKADCGPETRMQAFSTAARALCNKPNQSVVWLLPDCSGEGNCSGKQLTAAGIALEMAPQSQALYQQKPGRFDYQTVTLITAHPDEQAVEQGRIIGRAINLTRELINRGPHEVNPQTFADRAGQVAAGNNLQIRILGDEQLEEERMLSMLAVSRASKHPARLVILEYRGAAEAPFIGLVGKGVTYDCGGLSLKPSDSMKTMKSDMSGAATVLGGMQAVAQLKLPVNVRGYMGLAENMISGDSYRLGDVLTARNGVTIEVHNTDAEGRLVLADVLALAADEGCEKMIDLATLTGACVVALGEEFTGAFTNEQGWLDQLMEASHQAGEKVWQMPMCDSFADQLNSEVADCKNIGTRWGGAVTAAKFLEKFVAETPWIHLDIAGPAFRTNSKPYREGGASGVMVQTLLQLLES